MRGRHTKGAHLRAIAGTRPKPEPEAPVDVSLEILTDIPSPPDWLPNAHASKEWNRLAPILVKARMLTEANTMALGMLCSLHGRIVQSMNAGETPKAALFAQLRSITNDFRLTPASQGLVNSGGDAPPPAENPFSTNGKRA